jgi:subfamily B ATP-binding cassette protein MsbA
MPQTGMTAMFAEALLGDLMLEKPWLVIPLFLIIISVLRGIGYLIGSYGLAYVSNYLVHALRVDIFEKYLQLPFEFFDRSMSGHLVSVVTFNVQQVTQACTKALKTLLQQGSLVLGLMAYLFFVNWKLTLFFLAVMPFVALVVTVVSKRFRKISARIQGAMGDLTHVTQEVVNGYQEVRMFGGTENERGRIELASQSNRRQNMKMALTEGVSNPLGMLLVSVAFAGITSFMLSPAILETMSTGSFITFLVASGMLIKPIRQITEVNSDIQKGIAAAQSIFEILDATPERDEGTLELDSVTGGVEFKAINFSYGAARHRPTERTTGDIGIEIFSLSTGEYFRVSQPFNPVIDRQNNRSGNHITGQWASPYFVNTGEKLNIGWGFPGLQLRRL